MSDDSWIKEDNKHILEMERERTRQVRAKLEDVTRLTKLVDTAPSGSEIARVCLDILEMLLEKNISYGNSALNPINIFSKASTGEQLNVRIDDKLNRLKNGSEYKDEDTVNDLIGYLLLHKVWLKRGHDEATGTNS